MPSSDFLSTNRLRLLTVAVLGLWLILMLLALTIPALLAFPNPGDDRVRWSIRVALLFYGGAAVLLMSLDLRIQRPESIAVHLARWLWSLALAAYVVHVLLAFHYYHHWSHADAFARTQRISGFGPGLYITHLFGLLWALDVAWWWLAPVSHMNRPLVVDRLMHAFLAFIIFNGAVVFAEGLVRWISLLLFLILGGLLLHRILRRRTGTPGFLQPRPIGGIPRET